MKIGIEDLTEVKLNNPDDFLIIKETLSRIGIASKKDKTLYQSCHILHKRGKYYITHFKQMFLLDGKPSDFTYDDLARLNCVINLLYEWNLLDIVDTNKTNDPVAAISSIKIIPFEEKNQWNIVTKYSMGRRR